MATKYVSGRVKELKVGITSYSENKESLSVIGIVSATKYFGDGSDLTGTSTPGINTSGTSTFNNLTVTGNSNLNTVYLPDNRSLFLGNDDDLELFHTAGGNSYIKNNSPVLDIRGDATSINSKNNSVTFLKANASGLMATTGILTATNINSTNFKVTGVSTYQGDLDIESSVLITGITTIGGLVDINAGGQANTFKVEDLTSGRVVYAGAGGELQDSANLTFNGTTLTANAFAGNGAALTNLDVPGISTSGTSNFTNINVSGVSTFAGNINANGNIVGDNSTNITGIAGVTATTLSGTLQTAAQTNITSLGTLSAVTVSGNITANGNIVGDNSTNISGIASVTATSFHGDGSALTGIDATSLKDTGGTTRVQANTSGAVVTGVLTATTFKGALEGNVTGTLQTAAQPNVTSLGTIASLTASSAKVSDLTNGRVVYAGASGELQDSANLTFNGTTLTANAFAGDGSQLTNLPGIDTAGGSTFNNVFSSGINTLGKGANGKTFLYDADSLKFQTTGIGVSVASGTGKTAYIEGPEEIWIDPHPTGVGATSGIVRIRGDLYVDGKEVIIDVDKIELGDFQIGIATTAGTNVLLDGAGIGIGSTGIRKSITWNNATSALMSSENWNLASGKHYEIAGTDVLTATTLGGGVVNSSLTSLGTIASLTASTAKVSDLTNTRVVYAGASGELQDSANLTFNGTTLTANAFAGNGAALTNVAVTGINTGASSDFTDLTVNGNLKVTGVSTFTGIYVQDDSGNNDVIIDNNFSSSHVFITLKDNCKAQFGNGTDLQIYHGGSDSYVIDQGTGNIIIGANDAVRITDGAGTENKIVATTNGSVDLYYDNVKKFETTTTGVTVTGTCQATDFNSTSDIRLKDNIQVIEDPLAKLVQIEGVSFNWKENNKPALGVIADQVQEILPELVTDGDPKTVNYNGLIGLLIEAVKEQQIQIDELKSKLP